MDAGERGRDGPVIAGDVERLKVLVGGLVGALAQVQQVTLLPFDRGEELVRVLGLDVADSRAPGNA